MHMNTRATNPHQTHEGAPAVFFPPLAQLRRAVSSCLLWEDQFYEDGVAIADRIAGLVAEVCKSEQGAADAARLADEARNVMNLRHAPLWLLVNLFAQKKNRPDSLRALVPQIVRRADELGELLALYWKDGRKPIPASMKRGLADAFARFDEYQLAKYDRDSTVKLRDVMRLVHAKPKDEEQAALWKRVVDRTLATPDTWETALSGGADKREAFERLIREGRLGYLALLRNLRKMAEVGVDGPLIRDAILARKGARTVLPFRYVAAARAAPQFEPWLDEALNAAIEEMTPLAGLTVVLVDVSGSMGKKLSSKSDLTRMDAAATLASIIPGHRRVFSFSNALVEVPPRNGMAGVDVIRRSQPNGGTYLGRAVAAMNAIPHDRLIVITDEQSYDPVGDPASENAYMVNVAAYQNGVGYGRWTRIDGFSESVLRFIEAHERH